VITKDKKMLIVQLVFVRLTSVCQSRQRKKSLGDITIEMWKCKVIREKGLLNCLGFEVYYKLILWEIIDISELVIYNDTWSANAKLLFEIGVEEK